MGKANPYVHIPKESFPDWIWYAVECVALIVIAFLSAAFLTPPDPFSQISLALPIIILYEISIYLAKMISKNKDK